MKNMTSMNDAGTMREALALELVDWRAAGFVPGHKAFRFHRRVRILARLSDIPRDVVYSDLGADADAIELLDGSR